MDIFDLTRELGKKIQENEKYLNLKLASQINDEDEVLQDLIGKFNLKRISVSNEASKTERNEEKIKILNEELKSCYKEIMENENMINYNNAKNSFDEFMRKINTIIIGSANGEDPMTISLSKSSCTGDCTGCSGCH